MIVALTVFFSLCALDFVWAKYITATTSKRPTVAAAYASTIIVLSGTAAIGYVNDPVMLVPAAAGAFVGTYFAILSGGTK